MHVRVSYLIALLLAGCAGIPRETDRIRHVRPADGAASFMAVVVDESALVHTDQMFPVDRAGRVVGAGDPAAQVTRAMENLGTALQHAGSDFDALAKLNVYLAADSLREAVEARMAQTLPAAARPAIAYVTTAMERSDVLVAIDAVAASPPAQGVPALSPRDSDDGAVQLLRTDALHGRSEQACAGIMPAGGKVYISGQAEQGELLDAVTGTMKSLFATLAYMDLAARDVVQVKAFINAMSEASAVEERIEAFFREKPAPPIITTEWRQDGYPAEIELIASRREDAGQPDDPLTYVTPPGMSSSPLFSRVVEVGRGNLIYISGLYGTPGDSDRGQVEQTFERLEEMLQEAGSDINHLVKATYYYTSDEASRAINEVRTDMYNPNRPPAASKIAVSGAGLPGAVVTLDMIAVAPE